jgi:HNH endonuclease
MQANRIAGDAAQTLMRAISVALSDGLADVRIALEDVGSGASCVPGGVCRSIASTAARPVAMPTMCDARFAGAQAYRREVIGESRAGLRILDDYRGACAGVRAAAMSATRPKHDSQAVRRNIGAGKRRRVFERDGYVCVDCDAAENLTLDHIVPLSRGGTNVLDNLRTLCGPCNHAKADSLPVAARWTPARC